MKYIVESDRDCIVVGLAVFKAGDRREFSEYDGRQFEVVRGLKLNQCNVPEGVKVTVDTSNKEE